MKDAYRAITGTHRSPSTLDVLQLGGRIDRDIRAAQKWRDGEGARDELARLLEETSEQAQAIERAIEASGDKSEQKVLRKQISALYKHYYERKSVVYRTKFRYRLLDGLTNVLHIILYDCIYTPIVYALQMLLNMVLFLTLWGILIFGGGWLVLKVLLG